MKEGGAMVVRWLRMMLLPLALMAEPALAGCFGLNMLDTMPLPERQAIETAAHAVPYPSGNFWTATKGEGKLTIIGTYHLNDDRHTAIVEAMAPAVEAAAALLVEGGPEEQKAMLKHMADNPSLMTIT
ncbi:MAG: TraB/GumN family protein, partial [Tabrizicola sp.]